MKESLTRSPVPTRERIGPHSAEENVSSGSRRPRIVILGGGFFGRGRLSGLTAWLAWLGIHLYFLVGFRNRLIVMLQWAWSFFTLKLRVRLITTDVPPAGTSGSCQS